MSGSFGRRTTPTDDTDGGEVLLTVTPVLNEEALKQLVDRISAAVADAVEAALADAVARLDWPAADPLPDPHHPIT